MKVFISILLTFLLFSCKTTCPDGRKISNRILKPQHQFVSKNIDFNLKAIVDSLKKIETNIGVKTTSTLLINPLDAKSAIIIASIDGAYNLALNDQCSEYKFNSYIDIIKMGIREQSLVEDLKKDINTQIKTNGLGNAKIESINLAIKKYLDESMFK